MTAVALGIPISRPGTPPLADARPAAGHAAGPLIDTFGRVATDLRVSLTDRCNLRCTYCMPADGLDWMPSDEALTTSELARLLRISVEHLGIRELRFTGGEPLLRRDLADIVRGAASLSPRPTMSLTTNALGLRRKAAALAAAGLDRVNVSLDTVSPERFAAITRRDRFHDVVDGLRAARDAGLSPIKINAVLIRGVNDDEAPALLDFALAGGYELRIIEQMPLDAEHTWARGTMVTAAEVHASLAARFALTPDPSPRGGAPAERWLVDGGPAKVGIIASVTRPFCGDCDRTRLTADGQVRTCLFSATETDLRGALRSGADDSAVAELWRAAMWGKLAGHGINDPGFLQPNRPMSAIGG